MKLDQKVIELYKKLAGKKLDKVEQTTKKLVAEGKSLGRAMAESLEIHKCLPKETNEE